MVLKTTTSRIHGVIVVYLSGGLFFGEESDCLRTLVKELLNETHKIVFDLGDVTHFDSGAVGILVSVSASARQVGGEIKFANLGDHIAEVFHTTNLGTVFEIFGKTRDAIASFQ
jgi:anti-anti-sigma factor